MDAVTYLKEKKRMCDAMKDGCENCPMQGCKGCGSIEIEDPETAVDYVEMWSKEHPKETNKTRFLAEHREHIRQYVERNVGKPWVEVWIEKDWWDKEIEN